MVIQYPGYVLYVGDASDALFPLGRIDGYCIPLLSDPAFSFLIKKIPVRELLFAKQVHGNHGYVVEEEQQFVPLISEGDFLITQRMGTAIGVMTADCLPLMVYDKRHRVIGIAHAGWRGSALGVVPRMLERMNERYGTNAAECSGFFGPSNKRCCYQVGSDFMENISQIEWHAQLLEKRNDSWYFDVPLFNRLQLELAGMPSEAIDQTHNACTGCDKRFYSFRRPGSAAGRQIMVAVLL